MDYLPLHTSRVDIRVFDPESSSIVLKINVLLVDKSHDGIYPVAYQFKHDAEYSDESFSMLLPEMLHFDSDAFINLGEVHTIHKKNRIVLLRNGNTIMYNHLIAISDKKPRFTGSLTKHEELTMAYLALIDAVRTAGKVPKGALSSKGENGGSRSPFHSSSNLEKVSSTLPDKLRDALYKQMSLSETSALSKTYTATGKMLFELQI